MNSSQKTQYCQYVWFDNICFMRLNKYDMGPHSRTTIGAKIECGCTESSKGAHSTTWMHTTKYGCTQSSKDSQSTMWEHTAQYRCTQHNVGAHSPGAQWLFSRLAPPSHCFLHWGAFGSNGEHCGEHANTKSNRTLIWCHTSSHHHHCCHPLAPIRSSSFHLLTYHPATRF